MYSVLNVVFALTINTDNANKMTSAVTVLSTDLGESNLEAQKRDPLLGCYVLTAKDEGRQVSTAASQISSSDHPPPTSPFRTSDNPAIQTTEKHVIPAHCTSVHAHSPFGTQACPCRDFFQPFLLARLRDSCLFSKFELSCNIGRKWSVPQLLVNL
jgi:hypothetical protein